MCSMDDKMSTRLSSLKLVSPEKMKIRFDILHTKEIDDKVVVYVIIVLEAGMLDTNQAVVERRFSDFLELHNDLKKECPNAVKNIKFPKKTLFSPGITDNIIEERSRHFEKYLVYVAHQKGVLSSKAFKKFFYVRHLRNAVEYLKLEMYKASNQEYRLAMQLQKKFCCDKYELIPTMCGLVETSRNIEPKDYQTVVTIGNECLQMITDDMNPFLIPLLHAVTDARQRLLLESNDLKIKMVKLLERTSNHHFDTLRVLSVMKTY